MDCPARPADDMALRLLAACNQALVRGSGEAQILQTICDWAVRQAERLLEKDIPLLIHGETGVGRNSFAHDALRTIGLNGIVRIRLPFAYQETNKQKQGFRHKA